MKMAFQRVAQIGTRRQLTIPEAVLKRYGLDDGSYVMIELMDDHFELHPVVPVKRSELPEELREKFLSRRGAKSSDVPLGKFLDKLGYKAPKLKANSEATKAVATQAEAADAKL
jgi:bifunctional DNA-binding transcriptional regulator/antitoxin component of YhaV-PrlF toxin-antitoxin module